VRRRSVDVALRKLIGHHHSLRDLLTYSRHRNTRGNRRHSSGTEVGQNPDPRCATCHPYDVLRSLFADCVDQVCAHGVLDVDVELNDAELVVRLLDSNVLDAATTCVHIGAVGCVDVG
jgi:hypothetical protein